MEASQNHTVIEFLVHLGHERSQRFIEFDLFRPWITLNKKIGLIYSCWVRHMQTVRLCTEICSFRVCLITSCHHIHRHQFPFNVSVKGYWGQSTKTALIRGRKVWFNWCFFKWNHKISLHLLTPFFFTPVTFCDLLCLIDIGRADWRPFVTFCASRIDFVKKNQTVNYDMPLRCSYQKLLIFLSMVTEIKASSNWAYICQIK